MRREAVNSNWCTFFDDRPGPYRWSNVVGPKDLAKILSKLTSEAAWEDYLPIAMGTPERVLEMV